MHLASANGYEDIATLLLRRGANIECQDNEGNTALHHAVEEKQLDLVRVLISKGCEVNTRNKQGVTALQMAIDSNSSQIADVLKDCGGVV